MNILFIHSNFPGQFLQLAPYLAKHAADRTVFLTESDNPQSIELANVECVRFVPHRQPAKEVHSYLRAGEQAVLRGQAVLRTVHQLMEQGFTPDVAVVHGEADSISKHFCPTCDWFRIWSGTSGKQASICSKI